LVLRVLKTLPSAHGAGCSTEFFGFYFVIIITIIIINNLTILTLFLLLHTLICSPRVYFLGVLFYTLFLNILCCLCSWRYGCCGSTSIIIIIITNVEPETYDYINSNWSHWNINEKLKEKFGSCTRKTFDIFTTKDSYTWNISHNTENTTVWSLKPERWGSLLVQEKYQE
jgi:hypothetical protein